MMEKMPILIFRPKIPKYGVNFFVEIFFSFPENHRHKMTKTKATSKGTRSLLLKSAERT